MNPTKRWIALPDAPQIEGLRFRHFRDQADFEAMLDVIEACQEHDHVDPLSADAGIPTVDELWRSFAEAENIDLNEDLLLVEIAEQVAGFQWVRWWNQADGVRVYYHRGRINPAWRGRGIGKATLRWAERRIRSMAAQNPQITSVIRANTTMYEQDYNHLLLNEGYAPIHSFIELGYDPAQPLPDAPLPPGFALKPVTPEHYRAIWEANEEAFSADSARRPGTNEEYVKFLAGIIGGESVDVGLWQVAWYGDAVAGVALVEVNARGVGEITDLSVRPAYRQQGLARALIIRAVATMIARDLKHIRIFTDADDPHGARTLYESVGFRVLTEYIRYQKSITPAEETDHA